MLFIAILSKLKGHGPVKKGTHEGTEHSKEKEIWTHEGPICFKEKLAHVQRNKERNSSRKEFLHRPQNPHTCIS